MKRILDPSFRYRPSYATDLRRTFAALRREKVTVSTPVDASGKIAVLPLGRVRKDRRK